MERARIKKGGRMRGGGGMLEGSRSLELNINPWWFICCGSLQAPSAHRQLLAPISWPWTWMWKAGLLPSVPWHQLPWLGEKLHGPGQVLNLALIISERACACVFYGLLFILYNHKRRSVGAAATVSHTCRGQWGLTVWSPELHRCFRDGEVGSRTISQTHKSYFIAQECVQQGREEQRTC